MESITLSTSLVVIVGAMITALVVVGLPLFVLLVMLNLGKKGLFWAMPGEGQALAIMTSNRFSGFVMKYEGHHINDPNKPHFNNNHPAWERLKNKDNPLYRNTQPSLLQKYLGVEWIGLPPNRVYSYAFDWVETAQDDIGNTIPKHRTESTNFIYVSSFPYLLYLQGAETSENLQVSGYVVVEVECINPYKALFATTDWWTAVSSAIIATARSYVGNFAFEDLRKQAKDGGAMSKQTKDGTSTPAEGNNATSLLYAVCALNKHLPPDLNTGTEEEYGIRIKSARLLNIDVVGDKEGKILGAQTAKYVALQNADAARTVAEGDKDARITRAEGYKKEAEMFAVNGEAAKLIRYLEALKTEGKGDKVVVWPTLDELVKKIGGGK